MDTIKEQFEAAVSVIQSLPKSGGTFQPSTAMMLTFYALYKQATQGTCNTSRPAFYEVVGRAKWDAWKQLESMSDEDAMKGYVNELKKIVEAMPQTEVVQDFIEKLGNFYEMVDESDHSLGSDSRNLVADDDALPARLIASNSDVQSNSIAIKKSEVYQTRSSFGSEKPDEGDDSAEYHDKIKNSNGLLNGFVTGSGWKAVHHSNGRVLCQGLEIGKVQGVMREELFSNVRKENECSDDDDDDDDDVDEEEDVGSSDNNERDHNGDEGSSECSDSGGDAEGEVDRNNTIEMVNVIETRNDEDDDADDEEFCDSSNILFAQDERSVSIQQGTDDCGNFKRTSDASVQTACLQPRCRDGETNDEVLRKMSRAVEDMQKNLDEMTRRMKELEEISKTKVQLMSLFDFSRRFNIPTMCFIIFWPFVVNLLSRRFSRPRQKRL